MSAVAPDQQTPMERERDAIRSAEARGRRQQEVDARLSGHDGRLAAINGQIERAATETRVLSGKIDGLAAQVRTADAVGHALAKQATDAIERQMTRKELGLALATVIATLLLVVH